RQRGGGEIPFEAAGVEVVVEGGDQEQGVQVGGDDLLGGDVAGGLAGELVVPRQHRLGDGPVVTRSLPQRDPVPPRRIIRPLAGGVAEPAADAGGAFALGGVEVIEVAVFGTDTAGEAGGGGGGEAGLPGRVPSQGGQGVHRCPRCARRANAAG